MTLLPNQEKRITAPMTTAANQDPQDGISAKIERGLANLREVSS